MKTLYAHRKEAGAGNWLVYIHKDTLACMKGKLNNVGLFFSCDRSHVVIFPIAKLNDNSRWRTDGMAWICYNQHVATNRLCIIHDEKITSVCEQCSNYLSCVGTDFKKCKGAPPIDITTEPTIDLSALTFVGSDCARGAYSHMYGPLDEMDLTEEGISKRRKDFRERAQLGAKNRAYRKTVCSTCVMNCSRVRPQPDMPITEKLMRSVHDIFVNTIFDNDILEMLQWCKTVQLNDNLPTSKERAFIQFLFQSQELNYGNFTIVPFRANYFMISLAYTRAIVSIEDVKRIFEPNSHTKTFIATHRDQFLLTYGLLQNTLLTWVESKLVTESMPTILKRFNSYRRIDDLIIPGTSVSVINVTNTCTEKEILARAIKKADCILAKRKDMVTISCRDSYPYNTDVMDRNTIKITTPGGNKAIDVSAILQGIQ